MIKQTKTFTLDTILLPLVFFFPLIIILRSTAINIAVIAMSFIMLFYFFKKKKDFFKDKLVTYIFIYFSFIFLNSIIHFTSFELLLKSLGNFRYLLLSIAVFYVFGKISFSQKKFFIYFNITLIFLIALDILYQFIFYKDIFGFVPGMCVNTNPIKCVRFSGIFGNELIAGSYLSQIGFLILIFFLNLDLKKSYFNLLIKIFLCLFLFLIILLTGERSATLIIMISLFFIFFFKKKIISFFIIMLFLLTLTFFLGQKVESINSRFVKLFDSWGSTSEQKSIINKLVESPWGLHYQAAIELFLEKPILGYGPKSFRVMCENTNIDKKTREQTQLYRGYRACSTHPHNYLLESLSEHGLVGGLFFIGLILFIFTSVYKKSKNSKNEKMLIIVGVGSLILAIIFPFKPSGSFFSTLNASIFFYIFGFFLYYLKK
jgi:O-antigen ligase